ncbi:ABC transporter substrate-binding protein [Rhizobium lusitanum]|uniref:ABC transporter substrate-binding protein n=1 Tax=Rhizobium lusitanum TaxID=293958 RepID=A0A6L9UEX0_9HYPH|nr:ABC transporter substrate-binding protein [Rhizobium lusitanum]NEI74555.1 ABC transporter substrate-binding protein [Rhizobium lusitanum]
MNWTSALYGAGFAIAISVATPAFSADITLNAILPMTGPTAGTGELFKNALDYVFDEVNTTGGFHGNNISLRVLDDTGTAQGGTDRVRQAISSGARIILQGGGSAVAAAIAADVKRWNERNADNPVLLIMLGAEAADLTRKDCQFYAFRTSTNADMRVKALMKALYDNHKLGTKVFAIDQDYSWGREMDAAVKANAATYHYEVVGSVLHEVSKIQDFSPYVERIRESGAETVVTGNWARDLLLLMQSVASANLKAKFATAFLDEKGNIASAGRAALGSYIANVFNAEAGGPEGEAYLKKFHDKTGADPVSAGNNAVIALRLLKNAINSIPESDMNNPTAIALALEKAKAPWVHGEVSIRPEDHQLRLPLVVSEVSTDAKFKVDGTDMGLKPVAVLSADETEVPLDGSCHMKRPG